VRAGRLDGVGHAQGRRQSNGVAPVQPAAKALGQVRGTGCLVPMRQAPMRQKSLQAIVGAGPLRHGLTRRLTPCLTPNFLVHCLLPADGTRKAAEFKATLNESLRCAARSPARVHNPGMPEPIDAYTPWLAQFAALMRANLPTPPELAATAHPAPAPQAPCCLIFSPHPDDECIVGGLPLRLRREAGWRVVNVAVTLGSNTARRAPRWAELQAACERLGFDCVLPVEGGLERISPAARAADPAAWRAKVEVLADVIRRFQPQLVLMPHANDGSATHMGVHWLGHDAVEAAGLALQVALTEFWSTLVEANLMVMLSLADTADLIRALACHVGEVARNPYHLRLPAWLADSVRRGGELVQGAGSEPPRGDFATLYQLNRFDGKAWASSGPGRIVLEAQTPVL
jgi:N-acetylglucosamine malate deacetylase 1